MLKRCVVLALVFVFVAAGVASGKEPALTVAKPKLRAALNHGAIYPDTACGAPTSCAASLYQMMSSSRFLAALDRGGDTIGKVPFTSVATRADKVFVGPDQAAFKPAGPTTRNFVLQDF